MKKYILQVLVFILAILFALSFFPFMNKKKSKNESQILILNENDAANIKRIEISKGDNNISFEKEGGLYKGKILSTDKNEITFPCEQKTIENAISKLTKPIAMYKISDKETNLLDYGFKENLRLSVSVEFFDGRSYDFFIGKPDFTGKMRYVILSSIQGIWKIDYDFYDFSHLEARFWYEPYIFPRSVFSKNDSVQFIDFNFASGKNGKMIFDSNEKSRKLSELRHGSFSVVKNFDSSPVGKIKAEYEKGNAINLDFYEESGGNYVIHYHSDENSGNWNYSFYISNWTFNSLIENL